MGNQRGDDRHDGDRVQAIGRKDQVPPRCGGLGSGTDQRLKWKGKLKESKMTAFVRIVVCRIYRAGAVVGRLLLRRCIEKECVLVIVSLLWFGSNSIDLPF